MMFLSLLFWALLASYIVHILDEALLNGGFVQWIADNFWPTYTWRMFFWFNGNMTLWLKSCGPYDRKSTESSNMVFI